VLRDYLTRRASHARYLDRRSTAPRHCLVSVRSAVILAIATAGSLIAGWSQPGLGLGAWLALVVGLDTIIDRDPAH